MSLGVLAIATQPALGRQLDAWQLLPRPEHVTELYFTDYRNVPPSASPGHKHTITFNVHNLEHQTITYRYTLAALSEKNMTKEHPIGKGSFTLPHDHSKTTSKTVTLPPLKGRIAVKVSLGYKATAAGDSTPSIQEQSIHYWATTTSSNDTKENP